MLWSVQVGASDDRGRDGGGPDGGRGFRPPNSNHIMIFTTIRFTMTKDFAVRPFDRSEFIMDSLFTKNVLIIRNVNAFR